MSSIKWTTPSVSTPILFSRDITISIDEQGVISWDVPYLMGINMIDIYLNGELLNMSRYMENTSTSIIYTDNAENPLAIGDIISVRYRPSSVNFGNIRLASDYNDLANFNPLVGEMAIVMQQKKFYQFTSSGWQPFVIPFTVQNVGLLFNVETQVVTDITVRTYNLTEMTYPIDTGSLIVFINGVLVAPSEYTEVDRDTITFHNDLAADASSITFVAANTDSWEDSNSHRVQYGYDTNGNVTDEFVTVGSDNLKHTTYGYTSDGNIATETIVKGYKTIIKSYTYNESGDVSTVDVLVM